MNTNNRNSMQEVNMMMDVVNMDVVGYHMGMVMYWFSWVYCFMAISTQYTAGNYETVLALCVAALYLLGVYVFVLRKLRDRVKEYGSMFNMSEISAYNKVRKP